jgi:hypothetical protein
MKELTEGVVCPIAVEIIFGNSLVFSCSSPLKLTPLGLCKMLNSPFPRTALQQNTSKGCSFQLLENNYLR